MKNILHTSDIKSLKKIYQGKVRDIYEIDSENILIISTDRVSVFDVILPTPIPEKGIILNDISNYWFSKTNSLVLNHLSHLEINALSITDDEYEQIEGRSVIVKRMNTIPIEAIVRGYLIGSGYADYLSKGSICNIDLPLNLKMASKLPEIIFTPSSKAKIGDHDVNIDFKQMSNLIGLDLSEQIKNISIEIYKNAEEHLKEKDIILADTKFEFGVSEEGNLVLMDELLTPDSSRFWIANSYEEGVSPASLDKQFIRDYVKSLSWNDKMPAPELPENIVEKTYEKYQDIRKILMD